MTFKEAFRLYRLYVEEALEPRLPLYAEEENKVLLLSEWIEREGIVIDPPEGESSRDGDLNRTFEDQEIQAINQKLRSGS